MFARNGVASITRLPGFLHLSITCGLPASSIALLPFSCRLAKSTFEGSGAAAQSRRFVVYTQPASETEKGWKPRKIIPQKTQRTRRKTFKCDPNIPPFMFLGFQIF